MYCVLFVTEIISRAMCKASVSGAIKITYVM